jgi:four helix bundle protein
VRRKKLEGRSEKAPGAHFEAETVRFSFLSFCLLSEFMTELVRRTRAFALSFLRLADELPRYAGARAIASQLARSGTSVAANYRASQRARSRAEFRAKLQIAMEEVDESHFWIGLITDAGYLPPNSLAKLEREAYELTAIMVASLKTARRQIEK